MIVDPLIEQKPEGRIHISRSPERGQIEDAPSKVENRESRDLFSLKRHKLAGLSRSYYIQSIIREGNSRPFALSDDCTRENDRRR